MEIGGLPTIELARPLLDVVLNPGAKADEIFSTLAEIAPHLDPQTLAWGLLENPLNQAAALEHFYGADITPEVHEKLITAYREGRIDAEKLLVKCPSKYQGAEVEKAYSSSPARPTS